MCVSVCVCAFLCVLTKARGEGIGVVYYNHNQLYLLNIPPCSSTPGMGGHWLSYKWVTHHFEVLCAALGAPVVAGEQHFLDVVARAVVELTHVEGARLEAVEVCLHLQCLQDVLLHQVSVTDLVPEGHNDGSQSDFTYTGCRAGWTQCTAIKLMCMFKIFWPQSLHRSGSICMCV